MKMHCFKFWLLTSNWLPENGALAFGIWEGKCWRGEKCMFSHFWEKIEKYFPHMIHTDFIYHSQLSMPYLRRLQMKSLNLWTHASIMLLYVPAEFDMSNILHTATEQDEGLLLEDLFQQFHLFYKTLRKNNKMEKTTLSLVEMKSFYTHMHNTILYKATYRFY